MFEHARLLLCGVRYVQLPPESVLPVSESIQGRNSHYMVERYHSEDT